VRCILAKLLQPITSSSGSDKVEVEILTRSKDEAENKKQFEKIIEIIGNGVRRFVTLKHLQTTNAFRLQQNKVGTLPKDKMTGKFVQEWQKVLAGAEADLKEVDVALGVSTLLAVKDSEELVGFRSTTILARLSY